MTAATIGHASKPKSKRASSLWAENLSSFWFLLPIIIIFFILTVVPLAQSFFYSLTDYDGYSENFSFVAFSNYVAIFKDPSLLSALGFTPAVCLRHHTVGHLFRHSAGRDPQQSHVGT